MKNNELRIILVNDNERWKELFDYEFPLKIDYERDSYDFVKNCDPLNYNVIIIDASNDRIAGKYDSYLSEYVKSKNPNIIIIGTSIQGQYFREDSLVQKLYDEKISITLKKDFFSELKEKLKKYKFEIPEGVEK